METLKGFVEHIIYKNPENGYAVLNVMSGENEITCTGIFTHIDEGEYIEAEGNFIEHAVYGTQYMGLSLKWTASGWWHLRTHLP